MNGVFPHGWAQATLAELIAGSGVFSDGDWIESKDQDPRGEVRLIQLADIGVGEFRDRSSRFLTTKKAIELKCTYLEPGDILIARMPDPLGRACKLPDNLGACVTAVDVAIVRPGSESVLPDWLLWAINSPQCRSQVLALQSGTTRKRISRRNLATIRLTVPPLAGQQRIVDAIEEHFSRLDAAEATLRQTLTRLDTLRSSILADAFHANRELPPGWTWRTLGEISKKPQYGWTSRSTEGDGLPYLRTTDISKGAIDWTTVPSCLELPDAIEKYLLADGDILISRAGSVGISSLIVNPPKAIFASYLIRLRVVRDVRPEYVALYAKSPAYWRAISDTKIGIAVPNVNATRLAAIRIPVAPTEEQNRIVRTLEEALSAVDTQATNINLALERVSAIRRALLSTAFSGQLVAQDPDDDPASALLERIAASRPAKPERRRTRT